MEMSSRNKSSFQAQDASFGPEQGQGYVLDRFTSTFIHNDSSADREAHTEPQNFSSTSGSFPSRMLWDIN